MLSKVETDISSEDPSEIFSDPGVSPLSQNVIRGASLNLMSAEVSTSRDSLLFSYTSSP